MRPTKVSLIKKVCQDFELFEYEVVNILSDDALRQQVSDHSNAVIYSIANANQVDAKLFLTSHQFTNVVGTDIYIYIGTSKGQQAYEMLLNELSEVRRLDEKIISFIKEEQQEDILEFMITDFDNISDRFETFLQEDAEQASKKLIYIMLTESHINKGIGDALIKLHFQSVFDSHIFIYTGNSVGEQIFLRLAKENFAPHI